MDTHTLRRKLSSILALVLCLSLLLPSCLADEEEQVIILTQDAETSSETTTEINQEPPTGSEAAEPTETTPAATLEVDSVPTEIQVIEEEPEEIPEELPVSDASDTPVSSGTEATDIPDSTELQDVSPEETTIQPVEEIPEAETTEETIIVGPEIPLTEEVIIPDITGAIVNTKVRVSPDPDDILLTTGQTAETVFHFESCKALDEMKITIVPANTELTGITIPAFQGSNDFLYDVIQITEALLDGTVNSTERAVLAENCSGTSSTSVTAEKPPVSDDPEGETSYRTSFQIVISENLASFATGSNGIKLTHKISDGSVPEASVKVSAMYTKGDTKDSTVIGTGKYILSEPSLTGMSITGEDSVKSGEVTSLILTSAQVADLRPEKATVQFAFDAGTLASMDLGENLNGGSTTFNGMSRDDFISSLQADPDIREVTLEIKDYGTFQPFSMNDISLSICTPETGEKIHISYSVTLKYSSACSISKSVSKDVSITVPESDESQPQITDEESETENESESDEPSTGTEGTELPPETPDTPSTEETSGDDPYESEEDQPEDPGITPGETEEAGPESGEETDGPEPSDEPSDEPSEGSSETDDPDPSGESEEDPGEEDEPSTEDSGETDEPSTEDPETDPGEPPVEPETPDAPEIPEITAMQFESEEIPCAPASPFTFSLNGYTTSEPENVQALRFTVKPVTKDMRVRILFSGTVESYKIISVSSEGIASVLPCTGTDPTVVDFDSLLLTDGEDEEPAETPDGSLPEDTQFIWLYAEKPSVDFAVEEFCISGTMPDSGESLSFSCDTCAYVDDSDDPAVSLTSTGTIVPTDPAVSLVIEGSASEANVGNSITYTCAFTNESGTRYLDFNFVLATQSSFQPVTFLPGEWSGYSGTVTVTTLDADQNELESFVTEPVQNLPLVFTKENVSFIRISPAEHFSGEEKITGMSVTGIYTEPGTYFATGSMHGTISDDISLELSANVLGITITGPVATPTPVPTATPTAVPTEAPTSTPEPTPEPTKAPSNPIINPPVVDPVSEPTATPVPLSVSEPVISGTTSTIAYGDNALYSIREIGAEGIKTSETFVLHLMIPSGVQVRSVSIPGFSTAARVSVVYENGSVELGTYSEAHTASLTDREGTNIRYLAVQIKNTAAVRTSDEMSIVLKNISARDRVVTLQAISSVRDAKTAVLEQKYDKYNIALSGPAQTDEQDTSSTADATVTTITGNNSTTDSVNELQIEGFHPMLFPATVRSTEKASVKTGREGAKPLLLPLHGTAHDLQLNTHKPFVKNRLLGTGLKWQVQFRYRLSLTRFPFKHKSHLLYR